MGPTKKMEHTKSKLTSGKQQQNSLRPTSVINRDNIFSNEGSSGIISNNNNGNNNQQMTSTCSAIKNENIPATEIDNKIIIGPQLPSSIKSEIEDSSQSSIKNNI